MRSGEAVTFNGISNVSFRILQVLLLSLQSVGKLEALNVFKNVTLQFDTAKDEDSVEVGGMQVDFIVEEYGRIASALSASAGTQTGDAVSMCVCQSVCTCSALYHAVFTTLMSLHC